MPRTSPHFLSPFVAGLCIWCMVLSSPSSAALRCGTRIVDVGDEKADVEARCGTPYRKDSWTEEVILHLGDGIERSRFLTVEEWVYNFGPNRFMSLLRFQGERLVRMETRGYGFSEADPVARACTERNAHIGATKAEILLICGEPEHQEELTETVSMPLDAVHRRKAFVNVSEWTYDLGPTYFRRILIFRNNRLVEIRSGAKGE